MHNNFLTIKEASELTGATVNTVKRFIAMHRERYPDDFMDYTTSNNYKSVKISRKIIDTHFDRQTDTRTDTPKNTKDKYKKKDKSEKQKGEWTHRQTDRQTYGQTGEKYRADIIRVKELELLNVLQDKATKKEKTPILRHSTFWTAIISALIIYSLFRIGYYYKKELQSTHSTRVIELKEELQETKTAYHSAINRIDLLHDEYNNKLEDKDKAHKVELIHEREKLEQLQQELSKKPQPQLSGTTE